MKDILELIRGLERRITQLEERAAVRRDNNSAHLVIMDKEHDRVLHEMHVIEDTYAGHQAWSSADKVRYKQLRVRRDQLRTELGIKH